MYATLMMDIYNKVTEVGLPNYHGAWLQLPAKMCFLELETIAHTAEDTTLINFLKYGFHVGYEGPVPTPADHNHTCLTAFQRCTNYVLAEIEEGVMLGPVDMKPFVPWCKVNALLTHPKKDRYLRRVIMDLSSLHPPHVSINACTPKDGYLGNCKKMALPMAIYIISLKTTSN